MVEKDTKKFERETFKDRILRQLEEASQSLDDVASETGFSASKNSSVIPEMADHTRVSDDLSMTEQADDALFGKADRPLKSRTSASRSSREWPVESEPTFHDTPVTTEPSEVFDTANHRQSDLTFNQVAEDISVEDTAEIKNIKKVTRRSQESYTRSTKKNLKNWLVRLLQSSSLSCLLQVGRLAF